MRERYGLPQRDVRGLDHDLAYRALASGDIQATDLYSTDAEITQYHLRVLEDDLKFFPLYECIWLYRMDMKSRSPMALAALARLEGRITAMEMARMNARAKLDRVAEARVAADFLAETFGIKAQVKRETFIGRLLPRLGEHLTLVAISLSLAILVSIPLGVIAARMPNVGPVILTTAGLIQTIPSLALLVFMIPWLGIGAKPALVALFCTACYRSSATRPRACGISRSPCVNRPRLWDYPPARNCSGSNCQWRPAPSSRESRRRR